MNKKVAFKIFDLHEDLVNFLNEYYAGYNINNRLVQITYNSKRQEYVLFYQEIKEHED